MNENVVKKQRKNIISRDHQLNQTTENIMAGLPHFRQPTNSHLNGTQRIIPMICEMSWGDRFFEIEIIKKPLINTTMDWKTGVMKHTNDDTMEIKSRAVISYLRERKLRRVFR